MSTDIFLKLDKIKGESTDSAHAGEIDILNWNWGAAQTDSSNGGGSTISVAPGAGSGRVQGKVHVNDLTFTKAVDRSSPLLFTMCCSGQSIPSGTLTVRKAGGKPLEYLKINLSQVIVTSVKVTGVGADDRVLEQVSLNFGSFKYDYVPQKGDGLPDATVSKGWNIAQNIET